MKRKLRSTWCGCKITHKKVASDVHVCNVWHATLSTRLAVNILRFIVYYSRCTSAHQRALNGIAKLLKYLPSNIHTYILLCRYTSMCVGTVWFRFALDLTKLQLAVVFVVVATLSHFPAVGLHQRTQPMNQRVLCVYKCLCEPCVPLSAVCRCLILFPY